ncbi:MAG: sugar phosphate nucleotidyltransferase [Thermoleophilia bacterium]
MRAMIMAAGLGTRLMPLTGSLPKPMVPIAGRPALDHILDLLRRHGVTEVVINLHHFPDVIRDYFGDGSPMGMSIRWAYEEELLGTAGGVKNNQSFLGGGPFLVMSGDSLTDVDLTEVIAAHRSTGGIATLVSKQVADTSQYGVVVVDEDRRIRGFQEKPAPQDALSDLCNCGIYLFEPAIFEHIPADTFYDFGRQVFNDLLVKDVPFHTHPTADYWSDVGNLEDYRQGNFDALAGRVRVESAGREVRSGGPGEEDGTAIRVGEGVEIARSAQIKGPVLVGDGCSIAADVVIEGPVVLGDGTTVGPESVVSRSILWERCVIETGCEVEGSVFAQRVRCEAGARVRSSVLGEACRVGGGREVVDAELDSGTSVG